MPSIKLFRLVFCLFRFNRNIETLCFIIEAKQPKQTISKQTEKNQKNRKNPKFSEKIPKYAPYQTVSVGFLFVLVQSKHRKSLFRYRSETTKTNVLFRIVPKLVSGSSFGCFESKLVSKDTLNEKCVSFRTKTKGRNLTPINIGITILILLL
jgi:hypothetical protein